MADPDADDPPAACVLPGRLWIGSVEARGRTPPPWTTVITLMQQAEDTDSIWGRRLPPLPLGIVASHHYTIGDTAVVDITGVLVETALLIERAPGPVLVHCAMGKSRSAAVVVHYLWARGLGGESPDDALRVLQRTWPRAQPSASFMRQIAGMPRHLLHNVLAQLELIPRQLPRTFEDDERRRLYDNGSD